MDQIEDPPSLQELSLLLDAAATLNDYNAIGGHLKTVIQHCVSDDSNDLNVRLERLCAGLQLYVTLTRQRHAVEDVPDSALHVTAATLAQSIFIDCARILLGVEFQQLEESSPSRLQVKTSLTDAATQLAGVSEALSKPFVILQTVMANSWTHPILLCMMQGSDCESAEALSFIECGEDNEILRLRVSMLQDSGCDTYALNLCTWCVQSANFTSDLVIRRTQLLLLQKLGRLDAFHNVCWQVPCCLAVKLIQSLQDDIESEAPALVLAQTFLLQDWMQPKDFCCTKELLRIWMVLQRSQERDSQQFLTSIHKVMKVARTTKQLVTFIQVTKTLFGVEYLELCTEVGSIALKNDTKLLDSCRSKHDDMTNNNEELSKTCREIADLYSKHNSMCTEALLTALYLKPAPDLFFKLQQQLDIWEERRADEDSEESDEDSDKDEEEVSDMIKKAEIPKGMNEDLYRNVMTLLCNLRPHTYQLRSGSIEVCHKSIFYLEEAGYIYQEKEKVFKLVVTPNHKKQIDGKDNKSINSSPRKADMSPSKSVPTKDTPKKHSKSSDESSASCTSTSTPPERQSSSSAKDESDNDSSKVTSTTADIDVKCEPASPPSKHAKVKSEESDDFTELMVDTAVKSTTNESDNNKASTSGTMSADMGEDLSEALQVSDLVESVADEIFREFDEENEDKRADSKCVKEEAKEDEIVFLCHFCGKAFSTMSFRRHHQQWVCGRKDGNAELSKHRCTICGRTHQSMRALNKHRTLSHNEAHTPVDYVADNVVEGAEGAEIYIVLGPERGALARYGATVKRHRGVTTRRGSKRLTSEAPQDNNIDLLDQDDIHDMDAIDQSLSVNTIVKEEDCGSALTSPQLLSPTPPTSSTTPAPSPVIVTPASVDSLGPVTCEFCFHMLKDVHTLRAHLARGCSAVAPGSIRDDEVDEYIQTVRTSLLASRSKVQPASQVTVQGGKVTSVVTAGPAAAPITPTITPQAGAPTAPITPGTTPAVTPGTPGTPGTPAITPGATPGTASTGVNYNAVAPHCVTLQPLTAHQQLLNQQRNPTGAGGKDAGEEDFDLTGAEMAESLMATAGTADPSKKQIVAQKKMPETIITPPPDIATSPSAQTTSDAEQFVACGPPLKDRVWKLQAKKTVAMYRYSEIVCSSCGMRFDTMFRGRLHRKQEQTRPACFKASLHMYTIATMCPFCSKVFARVDDCASHITRGCPSAPVTDVQSALFRWHCRDCEKSFLTWSSLRGHVIAKHEHFLMKEKGVDMEKKLRAHYMVPSEHDDFELPESKPIPDEFDFTYLGSDVATQHRKQQLKNQNGMATGAATVVTTTAASAGASAVYQTGVTSSTELQGSEATTSAVQPTVVTASYTGQAPPAVQQVIQPTQQTTVVQQTINGQQYVQQQLTPLAQQAIVTQSVTQSIQPDLSDVNDYTAAGLALCDLAAAAVESGNIDPSSSTVEAAAIGITDHKAFDTESPVQGYVLADGSLTNEIPRPMPTPSPSESIASKSSIRSSDKEREKPVDLGNGIVMDQRGLMKDGKRIMHTHGVPMIRLSRFVCSACDEVFLRVHQAKKHVSNCTVAADAQMNTLCDFQCVFCSLVSKGPFMAECREHVKSCTKKDEYPQLAGNAAMNKCRICGTSFISKARMYQHILARHPDESPVSGELIAKDGELATTSDLGAEVTHQIQTIANPVVDCNGALKQEGMTFTAEGQDMQEALAMLGHTDMKAPGMFEDSPEPQQQSAAMFSFAGIATPQKQQMIQVNPSGQLIQNAIDKLDASPANVIISDQPGDHFHYICEHCKSNFAELESLATHRQYQCPMTALAHREQHICPYCKHEFQHVVALQYHVLRCQAQESPPIIMGGRSAKRRKAQGGDARSVRAKSASAKLTDTLVGKTMCHTDIIGEIESEGCKFRCRYCAKMFDKIMSMHSHILSRHSMMYQKVKFCDAKYDRALLPVITETVIHAPPEAMHMEQQMEQIPEQQPMLLVQNEPVPEPIAVPVSVPPVTASVEPAIPEVTPEQSKERRRKRRKRREAQQVGNSSSDDCSTSGSECKSSLLTRKVKQEMVTTSIQTDDIDVRLLANELNYQSKHHNQSHNQIRMGDVDVDVIDLTLPAATVKQEPIENVQTECVKNAPDVKVELSHSVELNKIPAHSKNDIKRYNMIRTYEAIRRVRGVINLSLHSDEETECDEGVDEVVDGSEDDSKLMILTGDEGADKVDKEPASVDEGLDDGAIADIDTNSNSNSELDSSNVTGIPKPSAGTSVCEKIAQPKWKNKSESDKIVSVLKLESKTLPNSDDSGGSKDRKRKLSDAEDKEATQKRRKHMWMCILCRRTFAEHSGWQDHMLVDHAPVRVAVDEDDDSYYGKHGAFQPCGPVLSENTKTSDSSHEVREKNSEGHHSRDGKTSQSVPSTPNSTEELKDLPDDTVQPDSTKGNLDDVNDGEDSDDVQTRKSNHINHMSTADSTESPTSTSDKYSQISQNGTDVLARKAVTRLLGQQAEALHTNNKSRNKVQP